MGTDQQPAPDPPTLAPTSEPADASAGTAEQAAAAVSPVPLAAISRRLSDAPTRLELAESALADLAANLAGYN